MADHMTAEQLRAELMSLADGLSQVTVDAGDADIASEIELSLRALAARLSALPAQGVPDSDGYYIACFRHSTHEKRGLVLWWLPDSDGYTTDLAKAGIYHKPFDNAVDDVPVPVAFARSIRQSQVIDSWADGNTMFQSGALLRAALEKHAAAKSAPKANDHV